MMKLSLILSVLAFPGLLVVALAPPSGGSFGRSIVDGFRSIFTSAPFWNFADPHTFSNKKSYEICDFFSESPVGLYESKGLSISGSLPRIAGSNSESWGSLVGSVFIKFTNGESVVSYTAKSASSPLSQVFDGQKDQVYHPKTGQLWLELYTIEAPKGESSIIVHDFNTDIFVMIHQQRSSKNSWFNIIVQGNTSESSGLLVDGCPEKYVDRKKPEALEVCRGISGSTDKSLNSTIAENICNHDTPIDPEMGSSVRSIVEMMNIFRDIVDSWFISNLVKAICK